MTRRAALLPLALLLLVPANAQGAPAAGAWETAYTAAACGPRVPLPVSPGETSLAVVAAATVPANDIVLNVFRNGTLLGTADSATSPEAYAAQRLDPPAAASDVVEAQVCPFDAGSVVAEPYGATGAYAWGSVPATPPLPASEPAPDGRKDVRVRALDCVLIPWGAAGAGAEVAFPEGPFNKATMVLHDHPDGDAFDRLLTVEVDGVEMFRATTPRADYDVEWDVTPYLSLLSGGTHKVFVHEESYLGRGHVVTLDFVLHEAKQTPPSVADHVSAPWAYAGLAPKVGGGCGGNLADVNPNYAAHIDDTRTFTRPEGDVRTATFYGYLTAHGCEEFWYSTVRPTPLRQVHLAIDGTAFADFVPTPYTYAFVGGYPEDPVWGPGDQLAWNTVQPVLADHGVYTGTGAVPPYVFDVTELVKGLAPGEHSLSIRIDNGNGTWFFSGQVLVSLKK
ncbi:MAG TPA: hypothetical protein VF519_12420 [Mycobacteriales bacterium]